MRNIFQFTARIVVALFLCGFFVSLVQAEDNALKRLHEAAIKYDNQLLIAKAQFDAAKGGAGQALAPSLPQLRLNARTSNSDSSCTGAGCQPSGGQTAASGSTSTTATSASIDLTQSIYEPTKFRAASAGRARAKQFGYLYGYAHQDLVIRLLDQYLNILSETDNLRALDAQRDRLEKQLQRVQARVEAGTSSRVDLAEISSSAALSASQYELSKINLRSFYEGLSEGLSLDIKNLPPIRRDLKFPPLENKNPSYWTELALENNLNLLAAQAAVEAAEEDVKLSRSGHIPSFDLFASYISSDRNVNELSSQTTQTEVGVRFTFPIFSGGGVAAGVRASKARRDEAIRRLNLVRVEIKTLVPSVVRRIRQGEELITASKAALDARSAAVASTELRYNSGSANIADLLLSYERLYEAERSYYSALYSHIRNHADLYVRSGNLDENSISQFYDIADLSDYDPNKPVYE